jgi:hypothetical protein
MAAVAALLDALPTPSTDGVGEVYKRLKSILGTTAVQQAKSSLLHQVEASILPPTNPKDRGQKATHGAPNIRTTSSLEGFSTDDRPGQLSAQSES